MRIGRAGKLWPDARGASRISARRIVPDAMRAMITGSVAAPAIRLLSFGAISLMSVTCGHAAQPTDDYPIKPIRFVVPQPPAGTADVLARMLAEKLSESLGKAVVIDNRPGASGTIGSGGHLAGELFKSMAGFAATYVNYRGTGPAIIALLANEVQFMFAGLLPAQVQIKAGKLRPLAVTSAKRSRFMPDLPTIAESGLPKFEVIGWYGVLAPARTPAAIVRRLNSEIVKVLALPDIRERIGGQGAEVVGDTPAQFESFLKADIARWAPVIKASGARLE